jgi:hypothetical protein
MMVIINTAEIVNGTPTVKKMKRFAAQVEKLIAKLKVYDDPTSVEEFRELEQRIKNMLDAIGCSTSGGNKESRLANTSTKNTF